MPPYPLDAVSSDGGCKVGCRDMRNDNGSRKESNVVVGVECGQKQQGNPAASDANAVRDKGSESSRANGKCHNENVNCDAKSDKVNRHAAAWTVQHSCSGVDCTKP